MNWTLTEQDSLKDSGFLGYVFDRKEKAEFALKAIRMHHDPDTPAQVVETNEPVWPDQAIIDSIGWLEQRFWR